MPQKLTPKTIITAHSSADYDALASMVGAGKLYPGAALIAPSMLERKSGHIFSDSIAYLFGLKNPKECDLSQVELLVVVDTHQASRIEHVKDALSNPGLKIHVYDHHPDSGDGLPAEIKVIKPWGATASIITHIIKDKGIALTADEATMLGLGIFEDTGSFTFSSTTSHDFIAAAHLRDAGMDMNTIAEVTSQDITKEQVHNLDTLLRAAETHYVHNIAVTISEVVFDKFMEEFSTVVHKFIELENLKVVFVLAVMGDRVHMIARSRLPEVDVGHICSSFGGGGHSYAASATIKDRTLPEIKGELLALLLASITPQMVVKKYMTSPGMFVHERQSMFQAEEMMVRYGFKAVPVVAEGTRVPIGILELQTASRAVSHKLADQPVSEYMNRGIATVGPDEDLYEAMEIILQQRQRLVPVTENEEIVGVLTRTDIIRLLIDESVHIPEVVAPQEHRERNIQDLVASQFPGPLLEVLRLAGKLGDEMGMAVYAVGGFVRDLLMRHPNLDTDLSVEGDGILFAAQLAARLDGRMRSHPKFRTATVFYKDAEGKERLLDVATARLEYYEHPAALPTVELSSIKMDLFRRDFTINALAVQLNEKRFGILVDPFGGQRDIKDKVVNILHSLSFVEDPTRIFRAVRFEMRFDFQIGGQTEKLVRNALSLKMLDRLSPSRLFNELVNVFNEKKAPQCIRRIEGWDIWRAIHPLLKLNPVKDQLLSRLEEALAWYYLLYTDHCPEAWKVYTLGLCLPGKHTDIAEALTRLGLRERMRADFLQLHRALRDTVRQLTAIHKKGEDAPMSELFEILDPVEVEGLIYLMARHGQQHNIGQSISLYFTRLRGMKVDITGDDLRALGHEPGPLFGKALRHVLHAKMDGRVVSREEQLGLAAVYMRDCIEGEKARYNLSEVLAGRT